MAKFYSKKVSAISGKQAFDKSCSGMALKIEYEISYLCIILIESPRSYGLVVRAVACEARGPGFNSSSDQMVFFSSGIRR